jgi:hypothetical protein
VRRQTVALDAPGNPFILRNIHRFELGRGGN